MKQQLPFRIVIQLSGGIIQSVSSNVPVQYLVYDSDIEGCDQADKALRPALNGNGDVEVYAGPIFDAEIAADAVAKAFLVTAEQLQQKGRHNQKSSALERCIFQEALDSQFISVGTSSPIPLVSRRDLLAQELLGLMPRDTIITNELVEQDSALSESFIWMQSHFILSSWIGKTVSEFLALNAIPGEPVCMNAIQLPADKPNNDGVHLRYITVQQLWDAEPVGTEAWRLTDGEVLHFHRSIHQVRSNLLHA